MPGIRLHQALSAAVLLALLGGCQHPGSVVERDTVTQQPGITEQRLASAEARLEVLDRISWGASASSIRHIQAIGAERYIDDQLNARPAPLPAPVQAQIDALTISQRPLDELLFDLQKRRRAFLEIQEPEERRAAQRAYQQELTRLGREAATRSVLRAIYSPNQLQEQMTWFWMNHFNVFQFKANLRAMVGDYEENAIRAHALGRFRDLLGATVRHPAMLRYLDNAQNGANRLNENYARELMELHTLGADGGYTQRDVQELARILTGVGIAITSNAPRISPGRQGDYVRTGAFEFNPNRHDYGDKVFLGRAVKGKGLAEVDEVLDRLARHPSTARFISRKLAVFFVSDDPPTSLVDQMARAFERTDGDIAATLRVLFHSPEFVASLGHKFKDPVHYVISGLRFTYDGQPIANAAPVLAWLNSLGQGLYNRQTPDGYPLTQTNWSGPGQMTARFEVARAIATGGRGLLGSDASVDVAFPKPPPFSRASREDGIEKTLSASTVGALERARSAAEWYVYFLSAPEFMYR
jgi:uncharacterized protein (DUF1800 family)